MDPTARLEEGVTVDPFVVIGPGAEIGRETMIGAGSVIGPGVRIGRGCVVSPSVTITHALLGDRVFIHPGVRIGQDGFGFIPGGKGHLKVPQTGRVIIQDDVEIGANSTIDRGSNRDTVLGEGTKIDNLVQIAHNVMIGRHCLIAGNAGISGSATIGDFVMMGGGVGCAGQCDDRQRREDRGRLGRQQRRSVRRDVGRFSRDPGRDVAAGAESLLSAHARTPADVRRREEGCFRWLMMLVRR